MKTDANVLVVDDNGFIRTAVTRMLTRLGYQVTSADSGQKGLIVFLEKKIDLVLSDYEMPGMDGVEFAYRIKNSSPRTPVVIMTGTGKEDVLRRKSTAVDEVISKPFTPAELNETFQNLSDGAFRAYPFPS